jgi:hypothetical protein
MISASAESKWKIPLNRFGNPGMLGFLRYFYAGAVPFNYPADGQVPKWGMESNLDPGALGGN